ncbi:MAG: DUF973 family protein [Promethearchaeota archaeon]
MIMIDNDINKFQSFSRSLGIVFRRIGVYSIIQIIAAVIIAVATVGMVFSIIRDPTPSAIFNVFQSTLWTILIASFILEVIFYILVINLIIVLRKAKNQNIPYRDKYQKTNLFFSISIVFGIILFIIAIFVVNYVLEIIWEIFSDPSFDIDNLDVYLEQVPSINLPSTLIELGRGVIYLLGFYFLKRNFDQLNPYLQNSRDVNKGFFLIILGYALSLIGSLLDILIDLGAFIGIAGMIISIVGYFKVSRGLKLLNWKTESLE